MIKTIPSARQLFAMVAFSLASFGSVVFLWLAFGGATPLKARDYVFHLLIPQATQLANQGDVRMSGVNVGKIIKLRAVGQGRTDVTVELQPKFAPLPRATRATLRLKTLLGETYIELSPASRKGPSIPDGGTLPRASISPTVQLDEILSLFDPATRQKWRTWMQSQAESVQGRGVDINATFGQLPGFTQYFGDLLATLDAQGGAVSKTVSTTGEFFDAISERQGELRGLIASSNRLFAVTGARNQELAAIFKAFPAFERESTATLPVLTRFGKAADPVVRQLQPAATELHTTFKELNALSPQFEGFFTQLSSVVSASRRGLPAFDRILGRLPTLLADFQPFLRNANPMVKYISDNRREVTSFFGNVTGATLARDQTDALAPGVNEAVHYLRTTQVLTPESLSLTARPLGAARDNAYQLPGAFDALAGGLPVLTTGPCANGEPAPPSGSDQLSTLVRTYAFRTDGRNVAAPPCRGQGPSPVSGTLFPQLRAEQP